jgi:hypothetical protein
LHAWHGFVMMMHSWRLMLMFGQSRYDELLPRRRSAHGRTMA